MNKYLALILSVFFIAGCSGKGPISVDLTQGNGYKWVHINEPTDEIEFNWHGGGWLHGMNRFKLRIPLGKSSVSGTEIHLNNGYEKQISVHASSDLQILGCKVVISLFNEAEEPFTFNGKYELPSWSCKPKT